MNERLKCLYPEEKDVKANYYEAKELFSKAAENGSTWGQYYMGVIYANAYGVRDCDRNHEKAIDRYYQSAKSGNLAAVCALGDAYYEGVLTYQDIPLAMEYYKKAADKNDSHGQYGIGICLLEGDRVEQKNGVKWIRFAAEQGYSLAEYRLGICLREGKGTPKNESEAIKWIYLAAEQGEPNAQYELALCYLNGNGIKGDNGKALKYFTLSAEQGNIDAIYYEGVMYINGMGTKINEQKAFKLFTDAANSGHCGAKCEIGKLYYFGKGVKQDLLHAEVIFRELALEGHYESMFYCGELYSKRNQMASAVEEYLRAADEGGFPPAQLIIGSYYERGYYFKKDPEKAFSYYLKAAQVGDMEGVAHLGVCYCNGIGTPVDYTKAIPLLEKGVNAGIGLAEYQLGDCYYYGKGVTENIKKAI